MYLFFVISKSLENLGFEY